PSSRMSLCAVPTARLSPAASSTPLPRVERRASLPSGFRAGGLAAGIKASGRPDLAVALTTAGAPALRARRRPHDGGSGGRGRRLPPERLRSRTGPSLADQPRCHLRRFARRLRLGV